MSRHMTKPTKWPVRPAKTSAPIWSKSSLCAQWIAKDPRFLHADSEDWSDWVDAQVDPSLRWAHRSFCWFCLTAANISCSTEWLYKCLGRTTNDTMFLMIRLKMYRNDPKFSDRYAWANIADPAQAAPTGAVRSGSTLFAIPSASLDAWFYGKATLFKF